MKTSTFILVLLCCMTSAMAQQLTLKWKTDTVFRVPESVLLDKQNNVLYVANIAGKSDQKDGNGFISKISPDGKVIALEWVSGLDAPKGMGLHQQTLYVADLTAVVVIDVKTGKITGRHEIEGAQFLNDITVNSSGEVFVSDSRTNKIHVIKKGILSLYMESPDFNRINGLLATPKGLYIADAGNGINYILSPDKKLTRFTETSAGADGVVPVGKNEYIVSTWGGEIFFVSADGKSTKMLDTKEEKLNSADIEFDPKTNTVFVPTFFGNSVMAYTFKR